MLLIALGIHIYANQHFLTNVCQHIIVQLNQKFSYYPIDEKHTEYLLSDQI